MHRGITARGWATIFILLLVGTLIGIMLKPSFEATDFGTLVNSWIWSILAFVVGWQQRDNLG